MKWEEQETGGELQVWDPLWTQVLGPVESWSAGQLWI